jgi:LysM repeat protein
MPGMKRGVLVASTLMLVAILVSACNQPYSQAPSITNTPINPDSLFATPLSGATQLTDVQLFASQTAQAANPVTAIVSSPTGGVPLTPQVATATSTPIVSLPASPTPTSTLAVPPSVSTSTLGAASGSNPSTYALQAQEFPYCIARRFNVNPVDLLAASNLDSPDIYYAGMVLTIPQNSVWPTQDLGERALRSHPGTYVVTGDADTTVYGVACKFGDVTPNSIVSANSTINLGSTLTVGQSLSIP